MSDRLKILKASRARIRAMVFGEPVTNVCAGLANPWRHAYFVRVKGDNVEITDRKGRFGDFCCNVIYPGHLSPADSAELFEPYWQAQYGNPTQATVTGKPT